jgi:hypothetical protein
MPRSHYDERTRTFTSMPKATTVDGVDIHIDGDDGTFWAKIGNDVVSRKNLSELKRMVARRSKPLVVLYVSDANRTMNFGDGRAKKLKITEVVKKRGSYGGHTSQYRLDDGNLTSSTYDIYAFDERALANFDELSREYEEVKKRFDAYKINLSKRWQALIDGLTRLNPEQVVALQKSEAEREIEQDGAVPFVAESDD